MHWLALVGFCVASILVYYALAGRRPGPEGRGPLPACKGPIKATTFLCPHRRIDLVRSVAGGAMWAQRQELLRGVRGWRAAEVLLILLAALAAVASTSW